MTRTSSRKPQINDKTAPRFKEAKEKGKIVEKGGYHQPNGNRRGFNCNCSKTTSKGAYRDVVIELEDYKVYYYHQHPIMMESKESRHISISNCGYQTRTTKQRLNKYLPSGYRVYQEDFEWYLSTPKQDEDDLDFENGMLIRREDRVAQEL